MKSAIVADSTILIGLERIQHLDILHALFEPLLVPPEVYAEFGVHVPWLVVADYSDKSLFQELCAQVHSGEAAALTLACEKEVPIILDDQQARSVGRRMGLAITGTVGVLIQAKKQGIILGIKPILDSLEMAGFYMDGNLRKEALRLAKE